MICTLLLVHCAPTDNVSKGGETVIPVIGILLSVVSLVKMVIGSVMETLRLSKHAVVLATRHIIAMKQDLNERIVRLLLKNWLDISDLFLGYSYHIRRAMSTIITRFKKSDFYKKKIQVVRLGLIGCPVAPATRNAGLDGKCHTG